MKKFISKLNVSLTILLLVGVTFSVITIASAVTPNPGHPLSEIGDGISTGSGALVLATSPTLVTPNIGVTTATSVTLSASTGSYIFANGFKFIQNGATNTVDMLDSGGATILEFDELQ